ncbi:MAG: hypothetical protein GX245_03680 [Eubacteriaceae bacterium]|jgi:UDP-3-O-[3-hydroxymyristoyl] glucosamine N-acyltransferase LpxD|nr:hypothetical protein [Eubacteriaceae bacterium]
MKEKELNIQSASYVGNPVNDTVMFISKKVEHLLVNLEKVSGCLVFCEDNIDIPSALAEKHVFRPSKTPNLDYTRFVQELDREKKERQRKRQYTLTKGGYYLGENVQIGKNAYIEPLCFIDHDVIIGDYAQIHAGAKIRSAEIGDYFLINENAVVGSYGFTMSTDESGNKIRVPDFGKVIIGNHVEIGILTNICVGYGGNTVIGNNVKIDSLVQVGHDVVIGNNVELVGGTVVGGFVTFGDNSYVGINGSIKNRLSIGENAIIGMGCVVTKNVPADTTFIGNPGKPFVKNESK